MPIQPAAHALAEPRDHFAPADVEIQLCAEDCLLATLDGTAQIVRTGQSTQTAITVIVDHDRLLVPLAGAVRPGAHVLGAQRNALNPPARWTRLLGLRHTALMPVHGVCGCMAEVGILRGQPFDDAATTPVWKKVRALLESPSDGTASASVDFSTWLGWMAHLADGLAQLETLDLAHGDPYPFNAVHDGPMASWVDFGHLTDDPAQIEKDAWAFVLFTVLHTHRLTRVFSPRLLEALVQILVSPGDAGGIFSRIGSVLRGSCTDLTPMVDSRAPVLQFAQALSALAPHGLARPHVTELLVKASAQYFTDVVHHIEKGAHYVKAFHVEAQRHRLMEREALRLTVPRARHEGLLSELSGQLAELKQITTQRDEQIALLTDAVALRNDQIAQLSRATAELERSIAQILKSHSWRITQPARLLSSAVRGRLGQVDKARVRRLLRDQFRQLPLPFKAKNVLRTAFFRLTGWSTHVPLTDGPSAGAMGAGLQRAHLTPQPTDPMMRTGMPTPDNAAAAPLQPYFGVRRPHGQRRAAILTNQLLDWHDGRPRFGGGERYALELARLLRELGIETTFFQPSAHPGGSGTYFSFEVRLLAAGDVVGEFHHEACSRFTELTADFDHVYYHLPEYASGSVREDGLMTCHGIWFDHHNYPDAIFRTPAWFEQLHRAFRNPVGVVSVDTNSIGVIRSLWPELAQKMRFIPNFFDASAYRPDPARRDPQRLTVLFPRRSQINRGSRIFGDIVSRIPHAVDIVWLGEGDPLDTQIVKDVCTRDPRASFHVADFDQMPAWYQKADIAVIPTLACEGTSLSCVEALASGCAVVATNVGGLPDLVYDGINGLLVEPEASSLANAINRLIADHELRARLQRNGAETAGNFELQMWRARWVELLRGYGWISDESCAAWFEQNHSGALVTHPTKAEKWVILTRNAIHGGVESLIREESRLLDAPVIVCGGHDQRDTCPFDYSRADNARTLEKAIAPFDVVLYHWLPDWALEVIRRSGKSAIEFVHRTDTSDSDKRVPTALVTHSAFLARFIHDTYGKPCRVVDHPIALDHFKPQPNLGPCIGAITSYYDTKGLDLFLRAWALLKHEFADIPVRFYGAGDDLHRFVKLARELGVEADFRPATPEPWRVMQEFRCFVVPSRIEGLPVAILEALAMNIPVVATALPGMQEFNALAVRRGYEAYVNLANPEDPQDLARVIRAVLLSHERLDSHRYIRAYHSPEKHCSDLVSVLREVRRH
jgi:glycosyltransferase involved in cell wall biosynthesis